MKNIKNIISEILESKVIENVSFVGCGGSLAGHYPGHYLLERESELLKSYFISSNEFVHATPKDVGEKSLVITASRRGDTRETVESARLAKELGATVIGLSFVDESELRDNSDYIIMFESGDDALFENEKNSLGLKIALELLYQVEGFDKYDDMIKAFEQLNTIVPQAMEKVIPQAIKFSLDYKDDDVIYTMASGSAWSAAYQQSICIFMEMQWINSSVIHTGEFFHGPFEITDPDTAYLMMKSTGDTRPLDDRAIEFITDYNQHLTVIDPNELGMEQIDSSISGYFDALFHTKMIEVFNNLLADMRNHPLSKRKFMWKYRY